MTNKTTSELDEYFPRSQEELDAMDAAVDNSPTDRDNAWYEFVEEINCFLDKLLPGATEGKRNAILSGACTTSRLEVLFDKQPAAYWEDKITAFVQNVEKKAGVTVATKSEPTTTETKPTTDQPQPIAPVANLDGLPEAPFSATVKIWHKVYGVEVLLTVRSTTVSDGIRRLDTMMDKLLGDKGAYQAQRQQVDAPSTANRRISADNAPPQSPGKPTSAPVRSFDPDADNKPKATGEILHEKICQIEKVTAPDGKVQINLYPLLPSGEARYPAFKLKTDADKEEIWKHVDVDKLELAKRYTFNATVDYVLSKNLSKQGNPYHNMRSIHPE